MKEIFNTKWYWWIPIWGFIHIKDIALYIINGNSKHQKLDRFLLIYFPWCFYQIITTVIITHNIFS